MDLKEANKRIKELEAEAKTNAEALAAAEASNAELTAKVESLEASISEKETYLEAAAKANEELTAKVNELEAASGEESEELKALREENAAFKEASEKGVNEAAIVKGTFKHEGKTYRFKPGFVQFRMLTKKGSEVIKSEEAIKDKEVMINLIEMGFGGLEEVVKEK